MLEALFSAIAEAVFGYLLQESTLTERTRAALGLDPTRRAFQTALARAYTVFARHYLEWTAALFDKTFLNSRDVVPLLAELLTRRGQPDPAHLARLFAAHLGHSDPDRWERLGDATRATADFLTWLEAELARQDALQPLYDSRALERIAGNTEAILRKLEENFAKALTEAQRYVQVADSVSHSAIVTGDYNTVTQVFLSGDYASLSDLYLSPEPVFHRVRLEEFSGRDWLTSQLDCFLSEHDCGVWLLVGEAGVGKTTFLAHLVRERRYLHFFAEQAPGEAGVTRALQSLAAQLVSRYRLEPYASHERLSPTLAAAPDFLERLLYQAANHLTAGEKLVIVVDALDEAGLGSNGNVLGLPKSLPPGVFLVLSQRPVSVPLRTFPYPTPVHLASNDLHNLADVETYLRGVARRPAVVGQLGARGYSEDRFVQVLKEKSAGNWMYLSFIVQEIQQGRRSPLDLEGLPLGLVGYYAEYWGRWRRQPEWHRLYAPLLAALAAAREATSLEQLRRWARLDVEEYRLKRLLQEEWAAFLFASEGRYRLYHASLQDFFRGVIAEPLTPADRPLVEEMAERTRQVNHRIAEIYQQGATGDWMRLATLDGGYGLRHLATHLAAAGNWDALFTLLTDFDFLEARCRATTVFDLEADYRQALAAWPPEDAARRDVLAAFEERVRLEASRIAQAPEWLFPALYNYLRWLDAPDGPLHRLCETAAFHRTNYLRSRLDPRPEPPLWLRSLAGHTDWVRAMALSPDGRTIVSGADDCTVKVWDAHDGRLLRSLEGHTAWVLAVALSPDGRTIVSGSSDRTLKVWDAHDGRLLRSLEGHTHWVLAVALSPDGRTIVSGADDRTVKVWNAHDGRLLRSLAGHTDAVLAVALSPDGRTIVSGSLDRTVKVWNAHDGRLLRSLAGHTDAVTAVALSPDGRTIVSGSWDNTLKVWDAHDGRLLRSLAGHTDAVLAVALSADGRIIVSGSSDRTLKVWDAHDGRLLRSLEGHTDRVRAVALSPDGRTIVSGADDRTVKVWDAASGHLLRSLAGHTLGVTAVALSPDGRTIVSGSWDNTLKVWDAASGRLLRSLEGHTDWVSAVALSPDGSTIVSGSFDRTVKVWDAHDGRLLRSLEGHTGGVNAVAVSPDGRTIVSGSWDNTLKVWDAHDGRLRRSLEGHTLGVLAVALSADGRTIVSGSHDRTVKVWEAESGHLRRSLEGHTDWVSAVALSPDGSTIVSGSFDRTVKVWDAHDGRLLRSLADHTDAVNAVALSADGRTIVSGSFDRTVKVWDAHDGRLRRSLEGHTLGVLAVALSADGRTIVSGSWDRTLKVWDARDGRLRRSLEGHTAWV
ncbi:AAA family ATPase, partial [Chloroflexus sp. MS-G]|uniref:AAA family ATPase n=1 Tax=Chloroflexus sp. MS-G TaxID=1521187 RepID=UPI001269153C